MEHMRGRDEMNYPAAETAGYLKGEGQEHRTHRLRRCYRPKGRGSRINKSIDVGDEVMAYSLGDKLNIGDIIQFGRDDWRVLDIQSGKSLILSEYIIKILPYHSQPTAITWEKCELRKLLNRDFCDSTFSAYEKEQIAVTTVLRNNDNPWYGTTGGNTTIDKVFLLSLDEVLKYFGDSRILNKRPDSDGYHEKYIDDKYNSSRIARTKSSGTDPHWWLRSPGSYGRSVMLVYSDGRIDLHGAEVGVGGHGVRPALWLNL
jgi:hypothetical protein